MHDDEIANPPGMYVHVLGRVAVKAENGAESHEQFRFGWERESKKNLDRNGAREDKYESDRSYTIAARSYTTPVVKTPVAAGLLRSAG
jgi:hypothetical protein